MHFEILIEDPSGKKMLEGLAPKIIDSRHTYRIISYKGIGHIPKGMTNHKDAGKRLLLDKLPKLLNGYGKTQANRYNSHQEAVIIVCDLDDRCLKIFRSDLLGILNACIFKPNARFCVAIEEGEAWLLGDIQAIEQAYPRSNRATLHAYKNDSICGTWEKLADAIYPGGSQALKKLGWQVVGAEKIKWADAITPYMQPETNQSPSFRYFLDTLKNTTLHQ